MARERKWSTWTKTERQLGWHLAPKDGRIGRRFNDGRQIYIGQPLTALKHTSFGIGGASPTKPKLCKFGMHASKSLDELPSMIWNRTGTLCLVLVEGDITDKAAGYLPTSRSSRHKICGLRRTVLFTADWNTVLRMKENKNLTWSQVEHRLLRRFGLEDPYGRS
jgi:hypothetical protein